MFTLIFGTTLGVVLFVAAMILEYFDHNDAAEILGGVGAGIFLVFGTALYVQL